MGEEIGCEPRRVCSLEETALADTLLLATLDLLLGQLRSIPGLESICIPETFTVGLLVSHLLLHILLDVSQIVFLLHLMLDEVEIGLGLALAVLELEVIDIGFFLSLFEGPLTVERQVSFFYPPLLIL